MCGICGVVGIGHNEPRQSTVATMIQALAHRGPDDHGIYTTGSTILGHTRLSIIDLSSNGHQPMSNAEGDLQIVFNGEVYNFQEIRDDLLQLGFCFRSATDTEVVLYAYQAWGEACVDLFEGMFAFAIWDTKRQRLFASRDRFGEKPLFYGIVDGYFYFASELQALIHALPSKPTINLLGLDLFLSYLFIPAPHTIFSNIYQLPPAHSLVLDHGRISLQCYWSLSFVPQQFGSIDSLKESLREHLQNAVKRRLISDVPLGVLLSGGVDSASIVASMREVTSGPIQTFTVGANDPSINETDYAQKVVKRFDTQHHELIVEANALEVLPRLIMHYGQPFADASAIPTYYVSQMARQYVTVALSGDGGDEFFGGYDRYYTAWQLQRIRMLPSFFRQATHTLLGKIGNYVKHPIVQRIKLASQWAVLEEHLAFARGFSGGFLSFRESIYRPTLQNGFDGYLATDVFAEQYLEADGQTLLERWIGADIATHLAGDYLTKVDIASMASSLEVRVPFLDRQLAEFAVGIPSTIKMYKGRQKFLLKAAFEGILPDEVLYHRKMGFRVPVNHWLRHELAMYVDRWVLGRSSNILNTYLNPDIVQQVVLEQRKGNDALTSQVWALLVLSLWEKLFLEHSVLDSTPTLPDLF